MTYYGSILPGGMNPLTTCYYFFGRYSQSRRVLLRNFDKLIKRNVSGFSLLLFAYCIGIYVFISSLHTHTYRYTNTRRYNMCIVK